jgi:hypothetical protein
MRVSLIKIIYSRKRLHKGSPNLCVLQLKNNEAEVFYSQALVAWEKVLIQEKESEEFVEFLKTMAIPYRINGKGKEAEKLGKPSQAIHIRLQKEKTLGSN